MSDETIEQTEEASASGTPGPAGGLQPAHPAAGARSSSAPDRRPLLPPVAYPLVAVLFGGAFVWSFSRILLTVSKKAAPAIALLMAMNILVGAALVAYGTRVRRRPTGSPLILGAGLAVIVAGLVAFNLGDKPPGEKPAGQKPVAAQLVAQNLRFVQTTLSVPAGAKISLHFTNDDASTPHNFVLFKGANASSPIFFRGAPVNGPGATTYSFTAPSAGTYFFHCEFHPTTMTGTVTVTPGPAAGGGGGGPAVTVTAKNLAFDPTQVGATGSSVAIHFVNDDTQVPHNIVVFNGSSDSAPVLVTGPTVTGPGSANFTVSGLKPGTYFFHCQYHPTQMKGTIVVR